VSYRFHPRSGAATTTASLNYTEIPELLSIRELRLPFTPQPYQKYSFAAPQHIVSVWTWIESEITAMYHNLT
jgi:hypothetical protein